MQTRLANLAYAHTGLLSRGDGTSEISKLEGCK